MTNGRGQRAVERYREMEETIQEQFETDYQEGIESSDDTKEFEREIIQFLSHGMRG